MAGACFFVVLLCLIEIKAGCIIKKELLINCVLNLMFYFNKKSSLLPSGGLAFL